MLIRSRLPGSVPIRLIRPLSRTNRFLCPSSTPTPTATNTPFPLHSIRPIHLPPSHPTLPPSNSSSNLPPSTDDVYLHASSQRRSHAAEYGSTRQPIIKLPQHLVDAVQHVIHSVPHRSAIRTAALGLYGKYRLTSSKHSLNTSNDDLMASVMADRAAAGVGKMVKPKLRTTYDHLTTISFAAGAMPSTYGATLKVLLETRRRLDSEQARAGSETCWAPKVVLDYGSGTGAVAWAAAEVWPDSLEHYNGLEKSSSMIWLSEKLLDSRPTPDSSDSELPTSGLQTAFKRITISPTRAQQEKHHATLTADLIDALEQAEGDGASPEVELPQSPYAWTGESQDLLAIMSFTLSDLPNQVARRQAVEGMWNSGAETMVIIDRGTPAGFQVVADARQQLLMLGRRAARHSHQETEVQAASSPVSTEPETSQNESVDAAGPASGAWVLAPCPHDGACPLHLSENPRHFCHFSQRIERPKFLKDTKHTSQHEEDAKYSYVVIRRGHRPAPATSPSSDSVLEEGEGGAMRGRALEWPRIILPPHKCKGHVIFDVCAPSARIERITIPRSQGKQAYYDARKAFWGDSWPHGSKKTGLVKTLSPATGSRGARRRRSAEFEKEKR